MLIEHRHTGLDHFVCSYFSPKNYRDVYFGHYEARNLYYLMLKGGSGNRNLSQLFNSVLE